MLTSVSLPNLDSIPELTLIHVPIYYRIESPNLDGHIPYVMNHECELKFFNLEPALELDLTLEPKLIFQELILFQEDLDIHTSPEEKVDSCCEDVCIVDEPLFLDKLFKDECNHSGKKIRVEDFKSKIPFEKRKLDLSIFTFDEPTNDQSCEYISQEDMITHTHHLEQFEDECDKDELVFQAKFMDKFNKFCEENFVEKPKISSNQVEPETDFFESVLALKPNILDPKSITSTNYILSLD